MEKLIITNKKFANKYLNIKLIKMVIYKNTKPDYLFMKIIKNIITY